MKSTKEKLINTNILKFLKRFFLSLAVLLLVSTLSIGIFVYSSPQFGQSPEGKQLLLIKESSHYNEGVFQNLVETSVDMPSGDMLDVLKEFLVGDESRVPSKPLPTAFSNDAGLADSITKITWYGHSAVLLVIDGKKILFDPMLGSASSPVPFLTKRFPYDSPIPIDDLGYIDFVIISHDHYDHLDMPTIKKIKENVGHFYTALGVESHLISWGIPEDQITSLDWWQTSEQMGLLFVSTPARHFSGRGLTDRNKTQWASWVVKGKKESIYFSGDGGYSDHFKKIGKEYGPFDLAMIECGQYNKRWSEIHLTPEETAQAALDLNAKKAMPIHWGAFNLSLHSWTDPIERVKKAAQRLDVDLIHPVIGRQFSIQESPRSDWWAFEK